MSAIKALIERMDQAPHEFIEDADWIGTRWNHITELIISESKVTPRIFTQEEIDAYLNKLCAMRRKQIEEEICIEILNPLREGMPEQMDLFPSQTAYPPGSGKAQRFMQGWTDPHMNVISPGTMTFGGAGGGGSGNITVGNSALRAMVDEQAWQKEVMRQKEIIRQKAQQHKKHIEEHKAFEQMVGRQVREKERESVLRRIQNSINDLAKKL